MRHLLTTVFLFVLITNHPTKAETARTQSLVFRENVGQITDQHGAQRKDILFSLSTPGMSIFIAKDGLHYQWYQPNANDSSRVVAYRMDVVLMGANKKATIVAKEQQNDYELYYTHGLNGALSKGYRKLVINNIYPDINWVLYFNGNTLKYDFEVGHKGDATNIKLHYEGAKNLSLVNGDLIAQTPFGSIKELTPVSYDKTTGNPIHSAYMLNGNELSYQVAQRNNVTIDPILDWVSYYGGAGNDGLDMSCVDNTGDVYFSGITSSNTNIATTGAYMTNLFGIGDALLAKFTPYGQRIWATYFGGDGSEEQVALFCNTSGVYIAGQTSSTIGLASANAYQQSYGGGSDDAFIAKFTAMGTLVWATYYGGSNKDYFQSITGSLSGDIYAVGGTKSTQFIATSSSFQFTYGGVEDAMLVKFSATGQCLWATYYGGAGFDRAVDVVTNAAGSIFLCGGTESSSNIATLGSFQSTYAGTGDGFIACFTPQGTRSWATYVGGSGPESVNSIACDNSNGLFAIGNTNSTTGIATAGTQQQTIGGFADVFIQKFDTAGNRIWGTYYGGGENDYSGSIVYLPWKNRVAIGALTNGSTNMATPNAINPNYIGVGANSVYAEFDQQGQLSYGTYLFLDAWSNPVAVDSVLKRIYLTGVSSATVGIATAGAYQMANHGWSDGVMACIIDSFGSFEAPYVASPICQGQAIGVQNNLQGGAFFSNNIFTVQLSNASGSFASPIVIGVDTTPVAGSINCIIPANTPAGNAYRVRVLSSHPAAISPISNTNITIAAISPPPTVSISVSPQGSVLMGTSVTFTATVTNGGTTPQYQWRKNGGNINGATNSSYTTTTLVSGDVLDVIVTSALLCAQPMLDTSNAIIMSIITGVENIGTDSSVMIHPNPFHDRLVVNANQTGIFTLGTIDGRVLMQYTLMQGENSLKVPANMTPGMYIATFKNEKNSTTSFMKLVYE